MSEKNDVDYDALNQMMANWIAQGEPTWNVDLDNYSIDDTRIRRFFRLDELVGGIDVTKKDLLVRLTNLELSIDIIETDFPELKVAGNSVQFDKKDLIFRLRKRKIDEDRLVAQFLDWILESQDSNANTNKD